MTLQDRLDTAEYTALGVLHVEITRDARPKTALIGCSRVNSQIVGRRKRKWF